MQNNFSTRWLNSCYQILRQKIEYNKLTKEQQEQFDNNLKIIPLDKENAKNFLKIHFLNEADEIIKQINLLVDAKNLEDTVMKKINEDKLPPIQNQKINLMGLNINNFIENVRLFHQKQPFFYDKNNMFWFWNSNLYKWEMVDDIDLMIALEDYFNFQGATINNNIKNQYIESFKRIGRQKIPKTTPIRWIQFKDKAFSLRTGNIYPVTPDYFFTNPLPYEMSETQETPTIDKLFSEWVGTDNIQTLYEIIAYCCYRDYPINLIFCFVGSGRNGKSCFLRLINKFLGQYNGCSTELDTLLNSRFESGKLYKKLFCSMGETNFGILNKTSLLKRLVGQDTIGYEYKGKTPFDAINYAKILIASNSLPTSEDDSEGFYRRWLIIDFPNEFDEGKDILSIIPEIEFNNLSNKIVKILPKLLKSGQFTNQGNIDIRKRKYIEVSNPLSIFIDTFCEKGNNNYIMYSELYQYYINFLRKHKKRKVLRKEFKSALENEGLFCEKTSKKYGLDEGGYPRYISTYWVEGLKMKENFDNLCANCANYAHISNSIPYINTNIETTSQLAQLSHKNINIIQNTSNIEKIPIEIPISEISAKITTEIPIFEIPTEISKTKILTKTLIKNIPIESPIVLSSEIKQKLLEELKIKSINILQFCQEFYQNNELIPTLVDSIMERWKTEGLVSELSPGVFMLVNV